MEERDESQGRVSFKYVAAFVLDNSFSYSGPILGEKSVQLSDAALPFYFS